MERAAWTDERLDDLAHKVDAGFERVDRDIRDLRVEMHVEMTGLRGEMSGLRVEMGQRFDALQMTMLRLGGAMILCLLGAIVAFSLGGS
jgi:hypothetical protein